MGIKMDWKGRDERGMERGKYPGLLQLWILYLCIGQTSQDEMLEYELQRYDGWYNNRAHPDWGSKESNLNRKTPASYSDGVYKIGGMNRPSPRQLSEAFSKGLDGKGSTQNRTALLAFFGQVVTSEILMASESPSCPLELSSIQISKCDEMYDKQCDGETSMPFYRAHYDRQTGQSPNSPREQTNKMTAWIDGSFIYSTVEPWVNIMRSFQDGKLRITEEGFPPFNTVGVPLHNFPIPHLLKSADPSRMYILGDARANQNPALLVFGILFYRWHNILAGRVSAQHPTWTDEDIFQSARRLNIASLQNIIAYEYLPAFLGEGIPKYSGYNSDIHPGVSHDFQSAAFRYGHTLIPPGIYQRGPLERVKSSRKRRNSTVLQEKIKCNFLKAPDGSSATRLCSSWWNAQDEVFGPKVENILRGMSSQIAEREDATLCADIRNKLFGPLDFSQRDLAALNIMRGRDSGLPDYNTVRMYFGLQQVSNWSDINPKLFKEDPEIFHKLENLYGPQGLQDIDLYIGGMLESDEGPGPLFRNIIKDQFQRIRDGDRFWFENRDSRIFTDEEIGAIRSITLWDIIVNATDVQPEEIQREVFYWRDNDPCGQPRQLSHVDMKPCLHHQKFDYFQGSEMAYIYGILLVVGFPLLTGFLAYLAIKYTNSTRRKIKAAKCTQNKSKLSLDKITVREMIEEDSYRFVKAKFGPNSTLQTIDRKGNILTKIDFSSKQTVMVKVNVENEGEYLALIKAKDYHDLVFSFDKEAERKRFLLKVEGLLSSAQCRMETVITNGKTIVSTAETKAKREKKLEHFFREAYSVTFGLNQQKQKESFGSSDVMSICLSREEFASALGMKPNDMFVRKMFRIVDKENNGRISFKNFLDTVILFTKGRVDEKLRIIYDMCEEDSNGRVDKNDFKDMLASLIALAKTDKIPSSDVSDLISSMFQTAGIENTSSISYADFQKLMGQFMGDLLTVGLDCKGAHHNFLDTTSNVARMTNFKLEDETETQGVCKSSLSSRWESLVVYLEENRQALFYIILFYAATFGLFIERFMHYSFMAEHTDLRKVMGVGIAITRGSASALTFSYSVLLLSVCRNLITKLKELSLHQYIPLDLHIQFHKICSCTALFFSLVHTAGHLVNFYHVSTQPVHHLQCMSREINIPAGVNPNITYWLFNTLTGITGLILYCVVVVIFIFALTPVRKQAFKFFWLTHQLYIVLYLLNLIHGLARITQAPKFWLFVMGPGIIYILDKIVSLRRSYLELDILETTLLPSDVIRIKFYRPPNYKFLSGQYIKVSCTAIQPEEFHSLTITSAPHEDFLSVHIKAIGPWTWKLRNYFDPSLNPETDTEEVEAESGLRRRRSLSTAPPVAKIRLQGPFGGGNQDWYKFEVAVMIGAGIGVTPYASILNDLVFGTSTNRYSGVACKKVYFLWICPSHRYFEWFIDVLRSVERKDVTKVLEMHIFITQFFHKFDLRTTMLYICENHFQQLSRRSLFTGLRAQNHFGRPDMEAFFKFVQQKHSYVSSVGVFSCGPRAVTRANNTACELVNRNKKLPYFKHHYEGFG